MRPLLDNSSVTFAFGPAAVVIQASMLLSSAAVKLKFSLIRIRGFDSVIIRDGIKPPKGMKQRRKLA
jgi:hypothetical protein